MNLIERVARALARRNYPAFTDADIDEMWEGWAEDATTAIQAMRDPTPEMIEAGGRIIAHLSTGRAIEPYEDDARDAWQAMIDASPIDTYEMEPIDTSFGVGEG